LELSISKYVTLYLSYFDGMIIPIDADIQGLSATIEIKVVGAMQ
jgi:hypothetical protein